MTTYITVPAKKRNFIIPAVMSERSDEAATFALADDTRIARNGDIRIARNGDTRIAHNTITGYLMKVKAKKRDFTIRGKAR